MNLEQRLSISYFKELAPINQKHQVFLVQHIETKKLYVKKILTIYNAEIYYFLQNHPIYGIPNIIACCEEDGKLTVIEEYIQGEPLDQVLQKNGPMDIPTACSYADRLCEILSELHHTVPPIIHRDIKPSNIMISSEGHMYLLDFNAAKYYRDSESKDTVLLGTHGFAAPEQYGFGSSSVQTDIYAIGILLKKLTEGAFIELDPNYSFFKELIATCTKLDPRERYASVDILKQELNRILLYRGSSYHSAPVPPDSQGTKPRKEDPKEKNNNHSLMIPGFRRKNPFFMIIAVVVYGLIFDLSCTLEVSGMSTPGVILSRIFCFPMFVLPIFFTCNYMDMQKKVPFCQDSRLWIRIPAILITDVLIAFLVLLILIILSQPFAV